MSGLTRLREVAGRPGAAFVASALVGFGARATETGAKFLLQFTLARTLGPAGTGDVFLALTIANVGCTVGRIGLDRALTMRIATARALGEGGARPLVASGLGLSLAVSAALALAIAAVAGPLAGGVFHDPGLAGPLRGMALAIVPLAMLAMVGGILNGISHTARSQLVGSALWPALAAMGVLLVRDAGEAVLTLFASISAAALAGFAMLWRRGLLPRPAWRRGGLASLTRIGWPLFAIDTVQITLISLPTLVLGAWRPAGEVGIFSLANRISLVLTVVLMVMAGLGMARMAAAHALGDRAGLQRVMRSLFLMSAIASAPAVLVLFAWAPEVLGLFGPGFAAGAGVLRWLLLGQAVGILFTCAPNLLEMTGNGRRLRRLNLLALAVNVGACLALIPSFGGLGAAWATTLTLISYNLCCGVMAWRHLRVHASPLALLAGSRGPAGWLGRG